MQLRDLMEVRGMRVSRLADAVGVSRQNIHVAFSRNSFSKELAGKIALALDAECVILPSGKLDFRPNGEVLRQLRRRASSLGAIGNLR